MTLETAPSGLPEKKDTSSQSLVQRGLLMFAKTTKPFDRLPAMHLTHKYKSRFMDVVDAFMCKYNENTRFCTTTICHVE